MNANEERKYSRSFASFADNQTEQCQERKGRLAPFAGMAPGPGNGGGRISGGNASNKLYGVVRVKNGGSFIMRGGTIGNNVTRSKIMAVMTRKCAAGFNPSLDNRAPPRTVALGVVMLGFVFVLFFSGCDLIKDLYGEPGGGEAEIGGGEIGGGGGEIGGGEARGGGETGGGGGEIGGGEPGGGETGGGETGGGETDGGGGGAVLPNAPFFSGTVDDGVASAIDMIKAKSENPLHIYLDSTPEPVAFSGSADLGADGLVLTNGTSPAGVAIDGGGRVITLTAGTGSVITVGSGVTLTLRNITFKGLATNSTALIKVDGGKLVLEDGAVITGNGTADGGGVHVDGGTFEMKGGTVSKNTGKNGGGVYMAAGTFNMSGGTISGNISNSNGTAYAGGGGVHVNTGTFNMTGGTISENTANSSGTASGGGGVNVVTGTFNMSGGTIHGNTANSSGATSGGGGVNMAAAGVFSMTGGTIHGNTESILNGGGVNVVTGTFNMNGGTISGNKATKDGGGVYVSDNGTFKKEPAAGSLTSGVIYGNEEGVDGSLKNTAAAGQAVKSHIGKRDNTAGPNVTVTTAASGWEQ